MTTDDDRFAGALVKALGHPLRLRLLEAVVDGGPASAHDLARRLGHAPSTVTRHVRLLRDLGFLESAGMEERRGAFARLYRAVRAPFIDDADWDRLPVPLRRGLAAQTLRRVFREASHAGGHGGFDAPGYGIARVPLQLDETGRRELTEAVYELIRRAEDIRDRVAARRAAGARVQETRLVALHFAVSPSAGDGAPPAPRQPPRPRAR